MAVSTRRALGFGVVALIALVVGCDGKVASHSDPSDPQVPGVDPPSETSEQAPAAAAVCTTEREYFAREVWGRVLGRYCVQCHAPGGVAEEQNASLRLLPSTYPGFIDANYDNLATVAKFSFDDRPVLLQKPIGELNHGGGAPLRKNSPEYAILERFIAGASGEEPCSPPDAAPADVLMLDPEATFRKATLQLADRLPLQKELARLQREGEAGLAPLLEKLMSEEAFIDRIVELYNDELLTDRYLPAGAAVNLLSLQDYPGAGSGYNSLDAAGRDRANLGIAREPLLIIAHVVREDLPFSEILTADYTMLNSGSASVYGVDLAFGDPSDATATLAAQVSVVRGADTLEIPHAGVLSTPAFLNRFPTTPTNRNRHRARKVYEFFLATDILKVADRPIDPMAAARHNNPTRDDSQCNGCHRQLDPIAGAFMKWNETDQERYEPQSEWHLEMVAPGFGEEVMETSDYDSALPWLAERIAGDPRFVLATVRTVFHALTGQEALEYPRDTEADDFEAQLSAWIAQDAMFQSIGRRFVDDDMRFKTVVRELVLSPAFRAANAKATIADLDLARFAGMGTARLSTPERLAAKIKAVTGLPWSADPTATPYLLGQYKTLYGGIDSDSVVQRLPQPNGIMTSIAARMADEVSCKVTAWDFTKASQDRALFGDVELSDVPESNGKPVAGSVARIREVLQHLHERVLGERLDARAPEIDRSFALFVDTWREASKAAADGSVDSSLATPCQAQVDPETGVALPAETAITSDPNHTIHAWMAVMTYLLSDYQFLYEP